MSDPPSTRPGAADALDATIARNADTVRRGRRDRSFLKRLGLSLPVTVDDVKQAFYAKAKQSHPDHHGEVSDFKEVQRAFDEAVAFAERNGKRLPWIGAQLPIYVAQREIVEVVDAWGGAVVVQELDWLEDTVGEDFAQLADRLVQVDLTGLEIGDGQLAQLIEQSEGLQYLETLLLADTEVTDAGVMQLARVASLRRLDLRGTDVSFRMRRQLAQLPRMQRVDGASRWGELFRGRS
ncbi:MAG: hypothetical protein AAGB00_09170 [Planctomycetota bacterium]